MVSQETLISAIHELHAIVVGVAEAGLELGVPTESSAEAVAESIEIMKRLALQEDFKDELTIIKEIEFTL